MSNSIPTQTIIDGETVYTIYTLVLDTYAQSQKSVQVEVVGVTSEVVTSNICDNFYPEFNGYPSANFIAQSQKEMLRQAKHQNMIYRIGGKVVSYEEHAEYVAQWESERLDEELSLCY